MPSSNSSLMIKVKKRQVQRFLSIRKRNQLHFEQKHSNLLALKQKHPLHIDTDSLKEKSDGTVKHKGKKVAFSRKMSDRLNKLKTHKKTSQLAAEKAAIKKDEDVQETYAEMTLPDSVINPSIQGIPPLDIEPSTQLPLRVFVYASLAMSCLCLISILFYALFFCRIKKRLSMARKQAGKRLTGGKPTHASFENSTADYTPSKTQRSSVMQEEPKMFCGGGLKIQIFQPSKQQQQQKQLPLAPTLINQSHIQTPEISFNKHSNSIERKSKIDDEWEWRRDYGMKSNKSVIRNDGSSKLDSPSTPMKRVVIPSLNSVDYYSDDDRDNLDDEYIVHQKSGPMISAAI